jgi:hypothetical protein
VSDRLKTLIATIVMGILAFDGIRVGGWAGAIGYVAFGTFCFFGLWALIEDFCKGIRND